MPAKTLSLKSIDKEVTEIKGTLQEAVRTGRNPMAIYGKLDNLFNSINNMAFEIEKIKIRLGKLENKERVANVKDIKDS